MFIGMKARKEKQSGKEHPHTSKKTKKKTKHHHQNQAKTKQKAHEIEVCIDLRTCKRKRLRGWHRLPGVLVGSPSLEVFKRCVDVAFGNVVSGHGGDGLMVGLDDLRGLFQPQ